MNNFFLPAYQTFCKINVSTNSLKLIKCIKIKRKITFSFFASSCFWINCIYEVNQTVFYVQNLSLPFENHFFSPL